MTTPATAKAVTSVGGAGLLASITQDPNFWVLTITAIIVSTFSFYYDHINSEVQRSLRASFTEWTKYVFGGQALMFLTFYGLMHWVPPDYQLPDTAWYMLSIVAAGYAVSIIEWAKGFLPALAEKFIDKKVK